MPRLRGPEGTAAQLLRRYEESRRLLAPLSLEPATLTFSARLALDMRLTNGMTLKLGREEQGGISATRRLKRFVAAYPRFVAKRQPPPKIVDLRYPNGFVLSPGRP
jgi:cell division protein FtsQ